MLTHGLRENVQLKGNIIDESPCRQRRVRAVCFGVPIAGVVAVVILCEIAPNGWSSLSISHEPPAQIGGKVPSWVSNLACLPSNRNHLGRHFRVTKDGACKGTQLSYFRPKLSKGGQYSQEVGQHRTQLLRKQPKMDAGQQSGHMESKTSTVTNEALSRRHFLSALGIAAVAAALVVKADQVSAAEATKLPPVSLKASEAIAAAAESSSLADPGVNFRAILERSAKKALAGGETGLVTGLFQAVALTWLYTANAYQYRYGGNLESALKSLIKKGGISRLYQGFPFALVYGPLLRFGDTAANVGVLSLLDSVPVTDGLPKPIKESAATAAASLWVILCQPVDTVKCNLQVKGQAAWGRLKQEFAEQGPPPLFRGWLVSVAENAGKDYPFFFTYNYLALTLPTTSKDDIVLALLRSALIGVSATCVAEAVTNSLRVVKTMQQTAGSKAADPSAQAGLQKFHDDRSEGQLAESRLGNPSAESHSETTNREHDPTGVLKSSPTAHPCAGNLSRATSEEGATSDLSVGEALELVLEKDGIPGLLGRGLGTRLLVSAMQGAVFGVFLKYFQMTAGADG